MQITEVTIHNFRSIGEVTFQLFDYSLLIGANNTGKTNVIDALRVFYEKDLKFESKSDPPKTKNPDAESWIDIEYALTDEEFASLKTEYQLSNNRIKVRKYLKTNQKGKDGKAKEGIYAYTASGLSDEHFYGAKNIQQGKLGEVIYIPAVSKLDEHMKTSGPSAMRDIINGIVSGLVGSSSAYQALIEDFARNVQTFRSEATTEDRSIDGFESDINDELSEWGVKLKIEINPISETEIVKSLVNIRMFDDFLDDDVPSSKFGQGFQRHLIYTLLRLSAKYQTKPGKTAEKKDFQPKFTLLLFEEPEVFLHPTQQEVLCRSLKMIAKSEGHQILLSTHSSNFVSNSSDDLPSIIRLRRTSGRTFVGQLNQNRLASIFADNQKINELFKGTKRAPTLDDLKEDMEAVKYFLWLDSERCGMFFARHVILVEGPTEKVLFNYFLRTNQLLPPPGGVFFLDCIGKYNMHRFVHILGALEISHSVLFDDDCGEPAGFSEMLEGCRNRFTSSIHSFPDCLEDYLQIEPCKSKHRKPQHVMFKVRQHLVSEDRLTELTGLLTELCQTAVYDDEP